MFCHKCGAQIADGAAFCYQCGTKIVHIQTDSPVSDETEPGSDPAMKQACKSPDPITENASPPEKESSIGKRNSKFKKWWDTASRPTRILTALGILLVGGFALYVLIAFLRELGYLLLGIAVIGGFIVTLITGSKEEKREARRTIVQMVAGAAVIIVIACMIILKPDFITDIFQPGASVRNAYLTQYSETVTVEEAFDNFFDNGKWDAYKADGYSYVAFTGACEYLGERADVKITFKITGENFVVDRLDVNGNEQNDLILYGLLLKVYENY